MHRNDPPEVLGRLFLVLYRSLPMYLADAAPWTHSGDERAMKVLEQIVADQRHYAQRIAEAILEERGRVDLGEYPMEFAEYNMLSMDFLISEITRRQKPDIRAIQDCVAQLPAETHARALAEEVLGNARGHLESLDELTKQPSGT